MFDCSSWAFLAVVVLHPVTQEARPLDVRLERIGQQISSVEEWIKTQQQEFGTLGINPDWLKPAKPEELNFNSLVPRWETGEVLWIPQQLGYDGIPFLP